MVLRRVLGQQLGNEGFFGKIVLKPPYLNAIRTRPRFPQVEARRCPR